ncbi:glycoside-pentoside-hexuronide (GPH):cation symporter [Micropruina sonneratiae]|uniref:glycoside-pentoside-hexuronide (GPH):cation symporter n=1 Tax=Micropruina sonneratiae TaxID=2986940 RepID=UPI002227160F|nr:glycoside-pentoside-hexuronide (GPH):cation symporter [Micropruina sp. KQZ13P-5]MCW3158739.1 glycoside-pentoside-hexuronide (GPH):cation symporter [Micropruina sp. KQZ13P-5]
MATQPEPALPGALLTRNRWSFGVGTLGRDMVYTLVSLYLIVYLTEALNVSDYFLWWAGWLILAARLFDAVMDIVMGSVVDNTRSRWGHYKPWILGGALASAVTTLLLFTDLGLPDTTYVAVFALLYLLWGLSWTMNDIPFWALLPALTLDQKERERIGALAKIFATIGLFSVVVAILPATAALGGDSRAWSVFTLVIVTIMLTGQAVTLFGVREPKLAVEQPKVTLPELWRVVTGNDQLLWTAISMVLFMTGYITTTSFGIYFFKYAYRDETMYTPFGTVLGIAQLTGFLVFPLFRKRFSRRSLYTGATGMIVVGYLVFFFAPMNMLWIGAAGLLLFIGQSFVVVLMLVFITDCIEYGHWKLGRRNAAVTFALQPFINKVGAALATQIVSVVVLLSGINSAATPDAVTGEGLLMMRLAMLVLPLVLIVAGYLIYRSKYRIDEEFYARILADLAARGQLSIHRTP